MGGLKNFDVEAPWMDSRGFCRPGASSWVSVQVNLVVVLKRQWLLYDLSEDLPPMCRPFIIPKTSQKVSFIVCCVKQNGMDGCNPPSFLASVVGAVEQTAHHVPPWVPLYGTHIDRKNAF